MGPHPRRTAVVADRLTHPSILRARFSISVVNDSFSQTIRIEMTRTPVLAAGGIVLRQAREPQIAVVRLRKRNEWVLPKGKLDDGEKPRDAAEREVNEETGHDVTVHEFLGTLVYESGGRSKIVHYWRMQADGGQTHELTRDIREVDWLPLEVALQRLSRSYERAFLENVGPIAVEAAEASRRKAKATPARRRPSRPVVPGAPPLAVPASEPLEMPPIEPAGEDATGKEVPDVAEPLPAVQAEGPMPVEVDPDPPVPVASSQSSNGPPVGAVQNRRRTFAELLRGWLRRAA
jgi:8-oxo-dGTP diphosphatase